ncbi:MAG: thiamine pyrophosphate-dependent enzyme [Candidatus Humimicrobiaceae bacterium]
MVKIKEIAKSEQRLAFGHRLCPGCGAGLIVHDILAAVEEPVVVAAATGCLEVSTTIYPYSSWKVPFIHSAFENVAATIAGVESAYRAFKKQGKIKDKIHFAAFGGDGGTYDIGLQSLSGAVERGHDFVYICYDNGAYMNTGKQRSGATPYCAATTTSPAGSVIPGKPQFKKDLTKIMVAHNIPYAAQGSPGHWNDLIKKAKKAFEVEGPAFLNVISPCPTGWYYDAKDTIKIAKEAVLSCIWPLYEVENGEYKLSYNPKKKKMPVRDWLKQQKRFKHLFNEKNEHLIDEIQQRVDNNWEELLKLCGEKE